MKDFIKWLGVNEKVGKVIVWLLIITIMLIITNTFLESVGLPYYRITVDNLLSINKIAIIDTLVSCIICVANFYSITLLVFRLKEAKNILKYAMLYLALALLINNIFNYAISQIFILIYIMCFCYFYSGKKKKYIIYAGISLVFNTVIQFICYSYKTQFLNFAELTNATKMLLNIDYFIIMILIILVKEIYIKKRGERDARSSMLVMGRRIQKRKNICTKTSKKSSKLS